MVSSTNVRRRIFHHIWHLKHGTHYNHRLQDDWRDGGRDAFEIDIIAYVPAYALLDVERDFIREASDPYNLHTPVPNTCSSLCSATGGTRARSEGNSPASTIPWQEGQP